jgi:hypothetical protein
MAWSPWRIASFSTHVTARFEFTGPERTADGPRREPTTKELP